MFPTRAHCIGQWLVLAALAAVVHSIGFASARQEVWVTTSKPDRVLVFQLDSEEGTLVKKREFSTSSAPGSFCFNADGNRLYISLKNPGSIAAYSLHGGSEPTLLGKVDTEAYAGYVNVHPTGRFLFGSYFATGEVSAHRILENGAVAREPIQRLAIDKNAHAAVFDPSGNYLFVPHTRPNRISQFRIDTKSGEFSRNDPSHLIRKTNTGPRHLWFHPRLNVAYGSDEQGSSISRYLFDPESGGLSFADSLSSLPDDYAGSNSTSDIEVHPTGRFVFIANRGHNSIAVFSTSDADGSLNFRDRAAVDPVPRSFNITPDGDFIIVAGQQTNRLKVFRISERGSLTSTQTLPIEGSPWWVVSRPRP